ncbi:MAG TPA: hypothetical protein PLD76_06330, partial [Paludibacteraceae bacterium]|nr:hypothetical protein [Paludibacteraceae bacterium]
MLYKRTNGIGFVAAKKRFAMEIEDIITTMAIIYCGGDIGKYGEVDFRRHIPKETFTMVNNGIYLFIFRTLLITNHTRRGVVG